MPHNDRNPPCVSPVPHGMMRGMYMDLLRRMMEFEQWFDQRFGWFFTNGMKARQRKAVQMGSGLQESSKAPTA